MNSARTFLIVDDDDDSRFLMRYALVREFPGASVIESASTEEALRCTVGRSLDGVITDHHLGVAGGDAFLRDLRARGVDCPIVMVTASGDPKVHRRAYEAGAAHVFANGDYDFVSFFRQQLTSQVTQES